MEICAICGDGTLLNRSHLRKKHNLGLGAYHDQYGVVEAQVGDIVDTPPKKKAVKKKGGRKRKPAVGEIVEQGAGQRSAGVLLPVQRLADAIERGGKETFSVRVLKRLEEIMTSFAGDALLDAAGDIVSRDQRKWDACMAAVATSSVRRLRRMTEAVEAIEEELLDPKRLKKAPTAALAALLPVLSGQQDRSIRFLEKLYGPGVDTYQDNHNTLIYMEGDNRQAPPYLATPEKREAAAMSVSRIADALLELKKKKQVISGGNGSGE